MAMPATTGSLKTKVSEMEIGDYIACDTDWAKMMPDTFSNLGSPKLITELPVTGLSTTGSGLTYFVKVAKGLLVSDRVIRNTVNWDGLNGIKLIQGTPWNTGNIIPTMTSNTSPSGVASASSAYNSNFEAWKAFDNSLTTSWGANLITSGWLAYSFTSPMLITGYNLVCANSGTTDNNKGMPKDWTFEASIDGVTWVILDEQTNQTGWGYSEKRRFHVKSKELYPHYRINCTSNNGANMLKIGSFEMFETVGIIRSLTGGVAYADANGNKSTTDLGFGGWPTNNEWDALVAGFPQEKIQAGKTLDDVFHWSSASSWVQDTPMVSIINSGYRFNIGNFNASKRTVSSSANVHSTIGFRPIFAYKE